MGYPDVTVPVHRPWPCCCEGLRFLTIYVVIPNTCRMTILPSSASNRLRRMVSSKRSNDHTQQCTGNRPTPSMRRRHFKQPTSRFPSEHILWSLVTVISVLLGVAITVLVHLLMLPSHKSFANFQFNYYDPSSSNNKVWNPDLNFIHKVRRSNHLESPIMVLGLPKAGTSSIFAYFHCMGFYSQHWYCCGPQHHAQQDDMPAYISDCMVSNLQDRLPILDGCGEYDVYTELNGPRRKTPADQAFRAADGTIGYRPRLFLPQHFHLEELHAYAPNATWILNVRPINDWVHSVRQVPANMLAKQLLFEAQEQNPDRWLHPNFWNSQAYRPNQDFLVEFWKEHIGRITSFVAQHPTHPLIWVNITNLDAGRKLAYDLSQVDGISFPILHHQHQQKQQQHQQHDKNSSDVKPSSFYSRAKKCWGAHNVKQHG